MNDPREARRNPVFTVVAHGDDWQFFMGADMYEHIRDPLQPVVIIQTTAGDAGKPPWYWKARQNGTVQSVVRATGSWSALDLPALVAGEANALADDPEHAFDAPTLPSGYSVDYDVAAFNGRHVLRCTVAARGAAPTTIYFLHLPDGHGLGWGFERYGHQSLLKLAAPAGTVPMTALWSPPGAAPAHYACWDEFLDTLGAIVAGELGAWDRTQPVWVHATVTDDSNRGEHSDHLLTTRAIEEVNERRFAGALRIVRFYTYVTREWEAVRNERQRAVVFAYAAGCIGTTAHGHGWEFIWDKEWPFWGGREYWQGDGIRADAPPCRARAELPHRD